MTTAERETEAVATARAVAAALTRDLRTPLQAVLGFANLLAGTDLDGDQRRLAEHMADHAGELGHACDRLALLLRLAAGETAPPPTAFRLDDLLASVVAAAAPITPVSVRVHPQLPAELSGDAEALWHLLAELIANAVRHGRRPLTVAADLAGAPVGGRLPLRLTVSDAGPGMAEDHLTQTNSAVPPLPEPGLIGIALATRLAARLGGTLDASQRAGGATEVSMHLTLHDPNASLRAGPNGTLSAAAEDLRILLVDDNNVNRILTQRQVGRLGYQLDAVATGAEGVEAACTGGYDVVLMDRHLPDLDGIEATRQIRTVETAEHRPRTPIVAITADAQPGHREECLNAGMDGFITKPVDIERLRAAILAVVPARVVETAPAPAGDKSPAEVDFSALTRLVDQFDGDTHPASEMVRVYIDELPDRLGRLQRALDRTAAKDVTSTTASLQAASATVGATGVARACAAIRECVQAGDFGASREMFRQLADLGTRTVAALDVSTRRQPVTTP